MHISKNGIDLIKKFEGCVLHTYHDAVGVLTIGYGHTEGVRMGMTVTQSQAEEMLKTDLANKYEGKVRKYNSTYHWNQNEFDALVSFAYNVGSIDALTGKGARAKQVIANKILLYNKAGGRTLQGLAVRRRKERKLFLTDCASNKDTKPEPAKKSGWKEEDGGWRFYNGDTGECIRNDWYHDAEKDLWYWFDGAGMMVTNTWYQYKGAWYYLGPDGAMCKSQLVENSGRIYAVNADGKMVTDSVALIPDQDGALQYPGLVK